MNKKRKKRTPSRQSYLEGQPKFHSRLKAFLSIRLNLSLSLFLSLSDSLSLMPGEPSSSIQLHSRGSECMSHMPHSHDIVGPGAAGGTSRSQGLLLLLLCIAHTALEPAEQEARR